jgi:hypothetical protein
MGYRKYVEVSMTRFIKPVASAILSLAIVAGAAMPAFAQDSGNTSGRANDRVDLRPKFRTGDQTRFTMDLNITSTQQAGEAGAVAQTVKQTLGLALKVKEAKADGTAKLEMVYESIKLEATSPLMTMTFDSSQPKDKDDPTGQLLRPLVGLTLALETDERGSITKVTPQVPAGPAGAAVPTNLLEQFTAADVVKGLFGPILSISAGSGFAKVGESWVNESTMQGSLGNMSLKNTYTLRSHEGGNAILDINGTVGLASAPNGGLADIKDGSIKGTANWDTKAGMLKSMEMTQRMQVATRVGDQSTSSTQDMTVRVQRK